MSKGETMEKVIDTETLDQYEFVASDLIGEMEWNNQTKVEQLHTLIVAIQMVAAAMDDEQQVIDEVVDALVEDNDGE